MKCNHCGTEFNSGLCPNCGAVPPTDGQQMNGGNLPPGGSLTPPQKPKWYTGTAAVVLFLIFFWPVGLFLMWRYKKNWNKIVKIVLTLLIVAIAFRSCSSVLNRSTRSISTATVQNEKKEETVQEETSAEEPVEEAPVVESVPIEYKSALKKAEQYSSIMYMSKAAIYDQLTSEHGEKFSPEAAQYAVDNLVADYNYNALKKAESYQESMAMSPEAIRDQLTSEYGEKFTPEEADYAIANLSR